jgi:hypothetical protein
MLRMWLIGLAAGAVAVTSWAVISRLRFRASHRNDLGTISDAWLHDPRSFPSE